jgi:dolichol kinase
MPEASVPRRGAIPVAARSGTTRFPGVHPTILECANLPHVSARKQPKPADPLEPLRRPQWLAEARRKAIHLGFVVLPLGLLHEFLPWPRGRAQFALLFVMLTVGAIAIDLLRLHDHRVRGFFRTFFGELIREHERFSLLGSTYLLLASLLAIEIFPQPVAAAALGFTVLGDALGALVGRAYGRHRFFNKSLEGAAGCLVACLLWGAYVAAVAHVPVPALVLGALVATVVEMLPIPLDDNLGITLASGFAMKLMLGGLPLN